MVALHEEYLAEIRAEVCNCCIEKPPGGPPCLPLGKRCGIERHLPQIVELARTACYASCQFEKAGKVCRPPCGEPIISSE